MMILIFRDGKTGGCRASIRYKDFVTAVSSGIYGISAAGYAAADCTVKCRTVLCKAAPRAATVEELHVIVRQFGEAAHRFQQAGGDGVEIQCAHAHGLLGGF